MGTPLVPVPVATTSIVVADFKLSRPHPVGYDEDKDGMEDEWERKYGLDPTDPNDHSDDLDGDGYTNIEEFLAIAATC